MTSRAPNRPRVLVIGLGNPDRGDDAVGIQVAGALEGGLPPGAALAKRTGNMLGLLEDWTGYDVVICVDAAAPMGEPGRVHRVDTERDPLLLAPGLSSSHGMGLAEALALARTLGTAPAAIIVYAIEGLSFELGAPLTPEVAAAVATVVRSVQAEVGRLVDETREPAHA